MKTIDFVDCDRWDDGTAAGDCHAIVLAAGRGRRLEGFTGEREGRPVPKQFAKFGRPMSLLQRTLRRLDALGLVSRTHVVVDATQVSMAQRQLHESGRVHLVEQPANRGTAAGVMLPLSCVMRENPESTVLLTPSDHAVEDEGLYRRGIFKAFSAIAADVKGVVLFGVRADEPRTDYGWILPGRALGGGIRDVTRFVEKPSPALARRLHGKGGLWSTMVVAARARDLWELICRTAPALGEVFGTAIRMAEPSEERLRRHEYESLPELDFSRDVLGATHDVGVLSWPSRMGWSDLGTPERLHAWLARRAVRSDGVANPLGRAEYAPRSRAGDGSMNAAEVRKEKSDAFDPAQKK